MTDLIRRKQPGEAWETAVDTGGGGSQPFAVTETIINYDDVGLEDGIEIAALAANDWLMDIQFRTIVNFDGTTPLFDIGTFDGKTSGYLADNDAPLTVPAVGAGLDESPFGKTFSLRNYGVYNNTGSNTLPNVAVDSPASLKIVVSQDGAAGGDPVGGSAGQLLVLVTTYTPS